MNRDKKLEKLLYNLRNTFGGVKAVKASTLFDLVVLTILADGNSFQAALRGRKALMSEFVDWNEVRVSSWKEIGAVLEREKLATPGEKGIALRASLEAIFAETNRMDLASLEEMLPEKASTLLLKLKGFDEVALAGVLYGGLAIKKLVPTSLLLRVSQRIGFIQKSTSSAKMKQALRDFVKRKDVFAFHDNLARIGSHTCFEKVTFCEKCPALKQCQHGLKRTASQDKADESRRSRKRSKTRPGTKKKAAKKHK